MAVDFWDLEQWFYSPEIWGYVGPIGLVILGFLISGKNRIMGVLYYGILVVMTVAGYFNADFAVNSWKVIILLVGGLASCLAPSNSR